MLQKTLYLVGYLFRALRMEDFVVFNKKGRYALCIKQYLCFVSLYVVVPFRSVLFIRFVRLLSYVCFQAGSGRVSVAGYTTDETY